MIWCSTLRRILFVFSLLAILTTVLTTLANALERQPNADYRARRLKLAEKSEGGAILVFAGVEAEGPNDLYGFRQDDNFYYLTGLSEPGAAVLIVAGREASDRAPAQPYTEILFLPAHNFA